MPDSHIGDFAALDPRSNLEAHMPRLLTREVFYKGQTIIEQGLSGNRAFYIERGMVEVMVKDGPYMVRVAVLGAGEIFGEMALIEHKDRSATVRALQDTTVTVITNAELDEKLNNVQDKAIRALIRVLLVRLRSANRGQMRHYKNLAEFQDRIAGLVEKASHGVEATRRDQFRSEVTPLLEQLDKLLAQYQQ
ncbi:MAG TPA: cyclic nucleotide-binding domain-containing protein [Micavibrio sp.]